MSRSIRLSHRSSLIQIALLVGYLGGGAGCATWQTDPSEARLPSASSCEPSFPDAMGWRGGDTAFSVPLPSADVPRSLWLFGDSFVDWPRKPGQRSFPFIHNSVGVSRCQEDGRWSLETYWRDPGTPTPAAFFRPSPNADWVEDAGKHTSEPPYYWPFSGFIVDDILYVGLLRIVPDQPRGPLLLPFRLAGMDLAEITNPTEPPSRWEIAIHALSENETLFPAAAFVVQNDHVYAFSFFDRGDGHAPRALTRFPLKALREDSANIADTAETLDRDGNWISGIHSERAKILIEEDATEMSVHHDRRLGRWLAVDASSLPANGPEGTGNVIQLRHAEHLTGPWSAPIPLYTIPETIPNSAGEVDPSLACYAAKAHPELSAPDELLVTYVCSLFAREPGEEWTTLRRLAASPNLYRPQVVRVRIPALDQNAPQGGSGRTD